ncbi:MAG: sporulation protein YqfD [Firmicutes bacterium]|nr:sporulation protein YqfD [Bacillota bacterium]
MAEWLRGYVCVSIQGDPDLSVLTDLAQSQVVVWNVRSQADGSYMLCLPVYAVARAVRSARARRIKLHFAERRGLPFAVLAARRRKAFVSGALMFVGALYILSSFVWKVQIIGTDQPEAVAAELSALHIHRGSLIYGMLDQDSVQLALLDRLPDIAWVGVHLRGTSIYVQVVPRIPSAKRVVLKPQNLVARVPAVVDTVLADTGLAVVKPGQFVQAGSVLISGRLEDNREVAATGTVLGIVWYRSDIELPEAVRREVLTGAVARHYYLTISGWRLPIWGFSRPGWRQSLVRTSHTDLSIGDRTLPFGIETQTVQEAHTVVIRRAPSVLTNLALRVAQSDALEQGGEGARTVRQLVLQRRSRHGKLYATIWTELVEQIAAPAPIPAPSEARP